jgi:hypothetical protein
VQSVNGVKPDANGNVVVEGTGGGGSGSYIITGTWDWETEEAALDPYVFDDLIAAVNNGQKVALWLKDENDWVNEFRLYTRESDDCVGFTYELETKYKYTITIYRWGTPYVSKYAYGKHRIINTWADLDNLEVTETFYASASDCHEAIVGGNLVVLRARIGDHVNPSYVDFTLQEDCFVEYEYITFVYQDGLKRYWIEFYSDDKMYMGRDDYDDEIVNRVISELPSAEGVSF